MKPTVAPPNHRSGFALVSTISMLVILTVVAIGLLSLSAISLRSNAIESAEMRARANARMALMMAIDRLQAEMGPDQRISANADILSANATVNNPRWLGTWDSWKAGRKSDGSPDTAGTDALSFHSTIQGETDTGLAPSYDQQRRDHFRSWLVSLPSDERIDINHAVTSLYGVNLMPDENASSVTLVEKGSLGDTAANEDFVTVPLCQITDSPGTTAPSGRYGWWVGDQTQKGTIMDDAYATGSSLTNADHIFRQQSPGSMGSRAVEELANVTDEEMFSSLPSFLSLDIIAKLSGNNNKPSRRFHDLTHYSMGVLADVREGGLKRDLSTLLERPIVPLTQETGVSSINDFMLYRFTAKDGLMGATEPQEIVPIQDLAAYYQLYDAVSSYASAADPVRLSSKRGVQYSSTYLANGPHLLSTDYGQTSNSPIYPREYSAQYRQPRVIKIQFLLSMFAMERPNWRLEANRSNPLNTLNSHELIFGITPAITFWNPTNLPILMQKNNNMPYPLSQMMRFRDVPIQIRVNKNNGQFISNYTTISGLATSGGFGSGGDLFSLYWSGKHQIRLEPGEVKTFSLPFFGDVSALKSQLGYNGHWNQAGNMANFFFKTDTYFEGHEVKSGWDPQSFILMDSSASPNSPGTVLPGQPDLRQVVNGRLRFKAADSIQVDIGCGANVEVVSYVYNQSGYQDFNAATTNWDRYNYICKSREQAGTTFNQSLFAKGMTGGATSMVCPARQGASIIARSVNADGWPFLQYSFLAGVETNESANTGISGGRKFATRPFLHSTPLNAFPFLDDNTGASLYNFGWTWSADLINDVYEAPVQVNIDGQGYFGGGYTAESGTTHVIQQDIPLTPPISIGALSGARLGGYSVATQIELPYAEMNNNLSTYKRQRTRAVGFGGMFPYVLQAIGNSYAHPLIPANQAYKPNSRILNAVTGPMNETMADHSYLANKALWDDYFFSSISPRANTVRIFESSGSRDAKTVAKDFFLNDEPLPNRRMVAYKRGLDQSKLDTLYADYSDFQDGVADKIAAHLMVEGAFNINSTSVEAWKVLFSSLKGKPVAYLESDDAMAGRNPSVASGHSGTPVGQTSMAGGAPYSGSPDDARDPAQWNSWRELTDEEIEELAIAMVEQVKLRGPFLSLSEFVNRRLEGSSTSAAAQRSAKGALQAALDDPDVSINEGFRNNDRQFSAAEVTSINPTFREAAEGPVAYGSPAYVDQADLLRNFSTELTPRGDTFVIRAYGDSLDAKGKVEARAWCEAVVQRLPEYVDHLDPNSSGGGTGDTPETKHADLQSASNKLFGRKMQVVSFRWLNSSEI